MSEGTYGELLSTIPPVTAPSWTSILTGVNPGKHGLFDFTKYKNASYRRELVSSLDIKVPIFPEILSRKGYRIGLVNVPMTYPPKHLNGFIVSGLLAPDENSEFTSPLELKTKLYQNVGDYKIDYEIKGYKDEDEMLRNLHHISELRKNAIKYLLAEEEWDLFFCVFVGIDRVQHWAWDALQDPIDFSKDNVILRFYKIMDEMIEEIISVIPCDTTVILVSDHGFGPAYKKFMVNRWLYQEGQLSLKKAKATSSMLHKLKDIYKRNNKISCSKIEETDHFFEMWKEWKNSTSAQINWSKTISFSGNETEMGIYINTKDRFPEGVVEANEYERVREDIIQRLLRLTDPENGKKVIQKVYRREEIFSGSYMNMAPDIVFETSNYSYECSEEIKNLLGPICEPLQKPVMGKHRRNGIFVAKGPFVQCGREIGNLSVYDVAPTILFMMDVPIPNYVDGRVLKEIFTDEYRRSRKIVHESCIQEDRNGCLRDNVYTNEDRDKIVEKLKGLGYLDSL